MQALSKLDKLRSDPRYAGCPQAFVVTGKPEYDAHNQELLRKNRTGYWEVAEGRVRAGDAMFVILPKPDRSDGYPRSIYGGVVKAARTVGVNKRLLVEVHGFELEATVPAHIKEFLGGMTPPQGNRANEVWAYTTDSGAKLNEALAAKVGESARDSVEARRARLAMAPKLPTTVVVTRTAFVRNADVVAETLYLARGRCNLCRKRAPFLRREDGAPYLEVHHVVPLAQGGEDTLENAIAVCPNCHRKAHYGPAEA